MKTLIAAGQFVKNKAILLGFLFVSMLFYKNLPENQPLPFAELLYAVILLLATTVLAPLMRLLVFPEVSRYAESGQMERDLSQGESGNNHEWLKHYRMATIICFVTSLICVSALLGH